MRIAEDALEPALEGVDQAFDPVEAAPTDEQIQAVLQTLITRLMKLFTRQRGAGTGPGRDLVGRSLR